MNNLQKVLLAANLLLISACASNIHRSETQADPYEEVNRKIFAFNDKVYENIYFPIIRGYRKITNQTARDRISSFVANVREPISTANYMLQLKPKETGISIARFAINSTLGLAGLFDVAGGWGLPQPATDMNETLASWCVADGPYLVVPFLAPGSA
ncbi:MAG: VacJ family lipoprotein, partial [Alphaproteobacteria bacterium]|nr:VacJ family lipoprotein [Alphaproteobacteria bacterium]